MPAGVGETPRAPPFLLFRHGLDSSIARLDSWGGFLKFQLLPISYGLPVEFHRSVSPHCCPRRRSATAQTDFDSHARRCFHRYAAIGNTGVVRGEASISLHRTPRFHRPAVCATKIFNDPRAPPSPGGRAVTREGVILRFRKVSHGLSATFQRHAALPSGPLLLPTDASPSGPGHRPDEYKERGGDARSAKVEQRKRWIMTG